jgi:hypothetical protein
MMTESSLTLCSVLSYALSGRWTLRRALVRETQLKRAIALIPLALLGSVSIPALANAQYSPYALDRLFLDNNEVVPLDQTLTFNSVTAVDNFFGVTSAEASLATQYFAGYTGSSANMLFSRFPYGGGRARLFSGSLKLSNLQSINSPLTITSEGYQFSANIDLAGVTSFKAAARTIQNALDANVPVAAQTTGSSITAEHVKFTGSLDQAILTVSSVTSGSIELGSYVSGAGITSKNIQIVAQLSGTTNGAGTYAVRNPSDNSQVPSETMHDSYGVLTVGSVSGTVAAGEQITGNVVPNTAIQECYGNGCGPGSTTWVVGAAQNVGSEAMTMTAAPLLVGYHHVTGKTQNSNTFWIEQQGKNDVLSSSMTYATGAAATALRLAAGTGASLSPMGEVVKSASAWMNNIVQNEPGGSAFSSFQSLNNIALVTQNDLAAWAQSTGHTFLGGVTTTTPPIVAQYANDRLFLDTSNKTPLGMVKSFTSATEVANFYGKTSHEAQLATEFYSKGGTGTMLFALYPALPWRANLYGSTNVTLSEVQSVNGPLSITSDGLKYTGRVNLTGVTSFSAAAKAITTALNAKPPIAAKTSGSSIASKSVSFSGSIKDAVLTVSSPGSAPIEVGSYVTGPNIPAGAQIVSQINGTPNGAGAYGLFSREGIVSPENMTDSYGVLTVGTVGSGTVALGEEVDAGPGGNAKVAAKTEIAAHLNGSGNGSTWVVNNAQDVSENLTMKGAPLGVEWNPVTGETQNSGSFWVHGSFSGDGIASSTLTYATGSAAALMGLAKGEAYLAGTGELATSPSAWMNNFVATEGNEFYTFQTTYDPMGATPPGLKAAMEAWAQSTGGEFHYLKDWSANTPPITNSLVAMGGPAAAPEPSTWAMMLLGFAGLGFVGYRRNVSRCGGPFHQPGGAPV